MRIIPVIDLKDGLVVHAKQGQRAHYAPIHSPLCQRADVDSVIAAYLTLQRFTTFYIADLNAIMGNPPHHALLNQLLKNYPHLTFWIDSGYQSAPGFYHPQPNYLPVLGSESYTDTHYHELHAFQKKYILSLDYSDTRPLGAAQLFTASALWPGNIIIMTLQRVGSNQGPDIEKLQQLTQHHPDQHFIAAGGIRNIDDINALQTIGIRTALLASALHSGTINAENLQKIHDDEKII